MCRHISAHHGTSPDDRSFPDLDVRQDDAVRPDKDIFFNHNFSVAHGSSGARVKVGDNGGPNADSAVIPNGDVFWMYLIDVHELPDPNVFPH